MHIVIVGDGKVGFALTEQLAKEGHDIVVIDKNKELLRQLSEQLDVMVLPGNGASMKTQREANVGTADLLIAATSMDEINLLCCVVARKLGCKNTIARVRNPEYYEQMYALKQELGLSMTVNPEWATAREIHRLIRFPSFLKRDSFANGRVEIVEIKLRDDSPIIDIPLMQLQKKVGVRVLVCAVERDGKQYIPAGDFVLRSGDKIYVTASTNVLAALVKALNIGTRKIRSALLIGGGRITHYLSAMLIETGISVKIIEKNMARCEELCEALPKATIVHGDGTEKNLLLAEGIEQTDTIVALTDMDEENLLISMFAKHLNVPKVITKINRIEYSDVFRSMGLESAVSPKMLSATEIVRYVRSKQNATGGEVLTIHYLVDGQVEALEFEVNKNTKNQGKTLAEITLKPGILIACINRKGQIIIPSGQDTLEVGDTVVVVENNEEQFFDLNDIFK